MPTSLPTNRSVFTFICCLTLLLCLAIQSSSQSEDPHAAGRLMLIVSDNQEHSMLGTPNRSMSSFSDRFITSVAKRPPLANVGGGSLLSAALRFGKREGADLVLHLGDAADVSCPEEIDSAFDKLEKQTPEAWFFCTGQPRRHVCRNAFKIPAIVEFHFCACGANLHQWSEQSI